MGLVSVRPAQAQLTDNVVHNFGLADGTNPRVGLIQATDGNYYGVTQYGGSGNGTVFKWDGTSLKTLHIFTYSDGSQPLGTVAQGSDGALYGTTFYGGSSGYGVIYKVNTDGSGFSVLHNFSYSDGANSQGDCLAASDGS
ncbi:MAG TPA: choice-of-anchor tandem repeat GloVer-containing protein, partial [Chthonomonadaceae bacterium]|nr:choice-of-anchor tandem repeat GloVer-containing protein [Chthonomonadaceae bacterium]